jgi:hypothetical protein
MRLAKVGKSINPIDPIGRRREQGCGASQPPERPSVPRANRGNNHVSRQLGEQIACRHNAAYQMLGSHQQIYFRI